MNKTLITGGTLLNSRKILVTYKNTNQLDHVLMTRLVMNYISNNNLKIKIFKKKKKFHNYML